MTEREDLSMFSLIKEFGTRVALEKEAPSLLISFGIAEFFYRFGSFGLECIAFLVTWFVLSWIQSLFINKYMNLT